VSGGGTAMAAGVRKDGVTHAVVRRRLRRHALCGAGPINLVLPFTFNATDRTVCRDCSRLVLAGSDD